MNAMQKARLRRFFPSSVRLWLEERDINEYFRGKISEAKKAGWDRDSLESIEQDWGSSVFEVEEQRQLAIQKKLVRRAQRWLVPVPKMTNANSDECVHGGERLLSDGARYDLLRDIRKAQREWLELIAPILGALAAVIAAATGLVAVWQK
jgi:hypothetical protein